jgi:hypothetical protein
VRWGCKSAYKMGASCVSKPPRVSGVSFRLLCGDPQRGGVVQPRDPPDAILAAGWDQVRVTLDMLNLRPAAAVLQAKEIVVERVMP